MTSGSGEPAGGPARSRRDDDLDSPERFTSPPVRLASATAPNSSVKDSGAFFRDAKICPDASCILTNADDRSLSLYRLPSQSVVSNQRDLDPVWTHSPSDSVLSYDWYPGASIADPAMFAFAVGVKDHPVQLLDGNDRRVRASYPIVDHTERFVAPYSMAFSPDGSGLYCGFENAIEIFDVAQSGAEGFRLATTPNRSSREGQKGLISTLDFSPSHGAGLLAAGSFSGTIGLYDPSSSAPLVGLLPSTNRGGVTKVLYHPTIPHLLFAASRQSNYLELFDLRNFELEPIRLRRKGRTNQRIGFDIDPTGSWLVTGDQHGHLSLFDDAYLTYTDSDRSGTAASAPFVIAIQDAGIKALPSIINAALLTSAWSAASSDLYTSSRTLYGLAINGQAPKFLRKTNRWGLPYNCVLVVVAFSLLSFMSAGSTSAGTVFGYFANMTSVCGLITWAGIFLTYIRWHKGLQVQGISRSMLPYRAPLQPYLSYYGLIFTCIILFFNGFSVFIHIKSVGFDSSTFVTSYFPIWFFPVLMIFYRFWRRGDKGVDLKAMDFVSGSRDETGLEHPEEIPSDNKSFGQKVLAYVL
ncbi:hypothetical protein JCM10212_000285 [Sporobolomyces blumeae]